MAALPTSGPVIITITSKQDQNICKYSEKTNQTIEKFYLNDYSVERNLMGRHLDEVRAPKKKNNSKTSIMKNSNMWPGS